jgi:hypothetical protein
MSGIVNGNRSVCWDGVKSCAGLMATGLLIVGLASYAVTLIAGLCRLGERHRLQGVISKNNKEIKRISKQKKNSPPTNTVNKLVQAIQELFKSFDARPRNNDPKRRRTTKAIVERFKVASDQLHSSVDQLILDKISSLTERDISSLEKHIEYSDEILSRYGKISKAENNVDAIDNLFLPVNGLFQVAYGGFLGIDPTPIFQHPPNQRFRRICIQRARDGVSLSEGDSKTAIIRKILNTINSINTKKSNP